MKYADLHIHTDFSDSTLSPEEVAACAAERGLSAVAICDHDCVDGIAPCEKSALPLDLEVIAGIELTVEKQDAEVHLLGYFIDWEREWFRKKLETMRQSRIDRIYKMVEKLNAAGIKRNNGKIFHIDDIPVAA